MNNSKISTIEEKISHTDDSGLTNRPEHEPEYQVKNKNQGWIWVSRVP